MKRLLLILLFLAAEKCFCRTFYVSATGSNTRSGLSADSAWQSLAKVASFSFSPFDTIRFKRNETFFGSWRITQQYIYVSTYGTGAKPVFTGFVDAAPWVNVGANIWETTTAISSLPTCMMVTIAGVNTPMGREPDANDANGGYFKYTAISNTSISSSWLTGNWDTADVIIRTERYSHTRRKILSKSGTTITFGSTSVYHPKTGYGGVITNHPGTLDNTGEWYYNGKLRMYSPSAPVGVKAAAIDTIVIIAASFVKFDSIDFSGANAIAFAKANANNYQGVSISNAAIRFCGVDAINLRVGNNFSLEVINCSIGDVNVSGIQAGPGCNWTKIINSSVANVGTSVVMIPRNLNTSFFGINAQGRGTLISGSNATNMGYVGIAGMGDSVIIENSIVDGHCKLQDDGAGFYYNNGSGNTTTRGIIIRNNIVLNGRGAPEGTSALQDSLAKGIYADDNANGFRITGNTVAFNANDGIFIHNARDFVVDSNITYGNLYGIATTQNNAGSIMPISNGVIVNNVFVAVGKNQYPASFRSNTNNASTFAVINNNYYLKAIADSPLIKMEFPNMGWGFKTIEYWRTYSGKDLASIKTLPGLSAINPIDFQYNTSPGTVPYFFAGRKKTTHSGTMYTAQDFIPGLGSKVYVDGGLLQIANMAILNGYIFK